MGNRAHLDQRSQLQQIALTLGFVFLLGGLTTLIYQFVHWFEYAAWPSLPTAVALDWLEVARPRSDWAILTTAINWTLDRLPLWGLLFLLSAFFFSLS